MYGSLRGSHESHTSSGDEPHSRNSSHDSSDYAMSGVSGRSRSSQHNQPPLRRGERLAGSVDVGMEGSVYAATTQNPNTKRQFANIEYTSGIPATGNIALELLKQTQNTKYLLGQGQSRSVHEQVRQPQDWGRHPQDSGRHVQDSVRQETINNPGSATNLSQISEGSSGGSSQYAVRGDPVRLIKDEVIRRKEALAATSRPNKPVMKKGFTEPPANSPKASRRNLSGMSSEESLTSRLRPGVSNQKTSKDFQEELMRLIDPDLSENDLVGFNSRPQASRKPGRLQRTLSDESLHNSKGGTSDKNPAQGDDPNTQRLSPRAVSDLASARQRSKSTMDNRVPMLESAAALDWSKLVNVASKAIDDTNSSSSRRVQVVGHDPEDETDSLDDHPPPRPPSPQMNLTLSSSPSGMSSSYVSMMTPQQKIHELEQRVSKLSQELDKIRLEKSEMEVEIQELRADNVRLQEESHTAATQLRRFTEWFFNTIDRQ
ncbi:unnamed protein product [Lymnaea stagnalis]|uniref:Uncharacterized protein n=1 Tax=Lymnaea stagnalis TaxID=6523 RepID=A0AAV2HS30_LYMST